jgi:hypothetical protein
VAVIVLLATGLPELSVPERLVSANLEPKSFEGPNNGRNRATRDDNIVSVHTHTADKLINHLIGKTEIERIFYPHKDNG